MEDKQIDALGNEIPMSDLVYRPISDRMYKTMDKQMIEEMAKVLSTVKRCDTLALSECIKKKCEYPHYEGVTCIAEHQAETLFNAGYRKIPENAVVLTRERYEELEKAVDSVQVAVSSFTRLETLYKIK